MQRRYFLNLALKACATTLALASLNACGKKTPQFPVISRGSTVLAFGDSLTAGYGASPSSSYPAVLAQITGWNIVNGGVSGDTTTDALKRLPDLLRQHAPKLVLTGIGGNDFLHQVPAATIRANIVTLCKQIKNSGAQNMLIAMPQFSAIAAAVGMLSDNPMYEEVATKLGIALQKGGWAEVLSNEKLRSDQIHANADGYAHFAQLLAKSLRTAGLLALK